MSNITPDQIVAFFADEAARVADEVARISALLLERAPGSGRPKNIVGGRFAMRIEECDADFMTKVGAAFEALGQGWSAGVQSEHDITGPHKNFVVRHESFKALPSGSTGGGRRSRFSMGDD